MHTHCPHPHKKNFPSEDHALEVMYRMWREARGRKLPVRTYHCPCGNWHLTSVPLADYLDSLRPLAA